MGRGCGARRESGREGEGQHGRARPRGAAPAAAHLPRPGSTRRGRLSSLPARSPGRCPRPPGSPAPSLLPFPPPPVFPPPGEASGLRPRRHLLGERAPACAPASSAPRGRERGLRAARPAGEGSVAPRAGARAPAPPRGPPAAAREGGPASRRSPLGLGTRRASGSDDVPVQKPARGHNLSANPACWAFSSQPEPNHFSAPPLLPPSSEPPPLSPGRPISTLCLLSIPRLSSLRNPCTEVRSHSFPVVKGRRQMGMRRRRSGAWKPRFCRFDLCNLGKTKC
ncbi:uncharacterized protein [Macaca fascicularis]|uniref:uncharacterized protein n=1 Tax=Macaca fascicularis TaxID=9541 RepID=UPI003D154388